MSDPDISVVMCVFNGARHVGEALDSVLTQAGATFEVVVVDDGSTDDTPRLLSEWAVRDTRLRVITQAHGGLTRALIAGCAAARGRLIARQDADDRSLPGRLHTQAALLDVHPEWSLVSCNAYCIGPEGERLDEWRCSDTPDEATHRLRTDDRTQARGVHGHGSTMFRRVDYERSGGYREAFYCAQDLDLWMRLTDQGLLAFVPEVLYEVRYDLLCVGTLHRDAQLAARELIAGMRRARARGESEEPWLRQASQVSLRAACRTDPLQRRLAEARGAYFIGTRLLARRDVRARRYLAMALQRRLWHVQSWWAWLRALDLQRKGPEQP